MCQEKFYIKAHLMTGDHQDKDKWTFYQRINNTRVILLMEKQMAKEDIKIYKNNLLSKVNGIIPSLTKVHLNSKITQTFKKSNWKISP